MHKKSNPLSFTILNIDSFGVQMLEGSESNPGMNADWNAAYKEVGTVIAIPSLKKQKTILHFCPLFVFVGPHCISTASRKIKLLSSKSASLIFLLTRRLLSARLCRGWVILCWSYFGACLVGPISSHTIYRPHLLNYTLSRSVQIYR